MWWTSAKAAPRAITCSRCPAASDQSPRWKCSFPRATSSRTASSIGTRYHAPESRPVSSRRPPAALVFDGAVPLPRLKRLSAVLYRGGGVGLAGCGSVGVGDGRGGVAVGSGVVPAGSGGGGRGTGGASGG